MRCNVLVVMMLPLVMMGGEPGTYQVDRGAQIPLSLMNDMNTAQSIAGDHIFLRTTFPVVSGGRVAIPPGSWVTGTITEVKPARRGQRRGELQVRFDSLLLPNGVSRELHGDLGAHRVVGPASDKTAAANTIVHSALTGAMIGPVAQIGSGSFGYGGLIGGAAAAAAARTALLLSGRGAQAKIARDTVVVMVLEEPLTFSAAELDFSAKPLPGG
jgi:hypothetical protein